MADPLEERCAELLGPATHLLAATVSSGYDKSGIRDALPAARDLQKIIESGTAGITSDAYLNWHASAQRWIEQVIRELEDGEVVKARELLTDESIGFSRLTIACAGQPGW